MISWGKVSYRSYLMASLLLTGALATAEDHPAACDIECQWDMHDCDRCCPSWTVIAPEAAPLFRPLIADPRAVGLSAAWRLGDQLFNPHTCAVSYGNHFVFFRTYNPWGYPGIFQFEVEGGLWALFEHTDHFAPLDNADYYVGFPVSYACGPWVTRLRFWHLSSHLGDEFLVEHPGFDRRNPSAEYLDLFVSYQCSCDLKLYGGLGWILRSDPTFRCRHFYAEYGFEYYMPWGRGHVPCSHLVGRPFVAAHLRTREDADYEFDGTFAVGYEWTKCCGLQRKIRLYAEYHNGCSLEGQFATLHTDYIAFKLTYGF